MKEIKIVIPDEYSYTNCFTEIENQLMLVVGSNAVIEFKKSNINNTTSNYYENIINKLKIEQELLKTNYKDGNEEIKRIYSNELEVYKKEKTEQIEIYKEKITKMETEILNLNYNILNKEKTIENELNEKINKEIDIYKNRIIEMEKENFLNEKNKENEFNRKISNEIDIYKNRIIEMEKENFLNEKNKENEFNKKLSNEIEIYKNRIVDFEKEQILNNEKQKNIEKMFENEYNKKLSNEITVYKNRIIELEKEQILNNEKRKNTETNIDHIVSEKTKDINEIINNIEKKNFEKIKIETEKNILLQKEIHEVKEKMSNILFKQQEKLNNELNDNIIKITNDIEEMKNKNNKSNSLGKKGEEYLYEMLFNTFGDFENFEIINTTKKSHSGDFHLKFKKFNILVDSKNFENTGVKNTDIIKIKKDIKSNQSFKIAWLVSIDKPIHSYNKAPFIIEIEDDGVCYVYINSLKNNEDPVGLLKTCWFCCNEIFDIFLNKENDNVLLNKYKKKDIFIRENTLKVLKNIKELKSTLKQLEENINYQENYVKDYITNEIMNIKEENTEFIKKWWDDNYIKDENGKLKINTVYNSFISKNENHKIDINEFKTIVKNLLDDTYINVLKTNKSAFNIIGWKYSC